MYKFRKPTSVATLSPMRFDMVIKTSDYSVSQSIEVHLETSPLTPLLIKERGKKQTVPQLLDEKH